MTDQSISEEQDPRNNDGELKYRLAACQEMLAREERYTALADKYIELRDRTYWELYNKTRAVDNSAISRDGGCR